MASRCLRLRTETTRYEPEMTAPRSQLHPGIDAASRGHHLMSSGAFAQHMFLFRIPAVRSAHTLQNQLNACPCPWRVVCAAALPTLTGTRYESLSSRVPLATSSSPAHQGVAFASGDMFSSHEDYAPVSGLRAGEARARHACGASAVLADGNSVLAQAQEARAGWHHSTQRHFRRLSRKSRICCR